MVHRQLHAVLEGRGEVYVAKKEEFELQCEKCNKQSTAADRAEREVRMSFLSLWLVEARQHIHAKATVVSIRMDGMEVVVSALDLLADIKYARSHTKAHHPNEQDEEITLPVGWRPLGPLALNLGEDARPTRERQGLQVSWELGENRKVTEAIRPFDTIDVIVAPLQTKPISLGVFLDVPYQYRD
eukprot:3715622-Amphidinium_carterae.1